MISKQSVFYFLKIYLFKKASMQGHGAGVPQGQKILSRLCAEGIAHHDPETTT